MALAYPALVADDAWWSAPRADHGSARGVRSLIDTQEPVWPQALESGVRIAGKRHRYPAAAPLPAWLRIAGLVAVVVVIAVVVLRIFVWPAPAARIQGPRDGAVLSALEQTAQGV